MAGRHLKPINRQGRQRRTLKSLPSLSCDWPNYDYDNCVTEKTIDATIAKKEKVAA